MEKVDGGGEGPAAEDDVFFDEDEFLTGTIFGTGANSTGDNGTAGMSESLNLFQSIHVLQADERVNGTGAGHCHYLHSISCPRLQKLSFPQSYWPGLNEGKSTH